MKTWVEKNYKLCLILLCLFAFVVRFYRVGEIQSYIFDEVYHAVTAKLIARNDPRAYEWWNPPIEPNTAVDWLHPPLAKYTQAVGIKVFGETPFGWRISSVLFGTAVIYLTARLGEYLFKSKTIGLLAGMLAAFDGLLLVQSRLAMNDVHVTFFLLLTFLTYAWYRRSLQRVINKPQQLAAQKSSLRKKLLLAVVCAGLSMGTKWSGLFGLGVIWAFEFLFLITELNKIAPTTKKAVNTIIGRVLLLVVLPFSIYVLSYTHMFLQGKTLVCTSDLIQNGSCYCSQESSGWVNALKAISSGDGNGWERLEARGGCKRLISHFSELHHQIWWYQTTLKATHAYQSRPLQWFLNLRPVWMYVKYDDGKVANIYAQGNTALFWIGDLAIFATLFLLARYSVQQLTQKVSVKSKKALEILTRWIRALTDFDTAHGALFFLTFAYFAVWLPWQTSPRIMFFYHYTPAVPLLAINLAYWMNRLAAYRVGRLISAAILFSVALVFVVFFANWTGLTVSAKMANEVYFAIKSWK